MKKSTMSKLSKAAKKVPIKKMAKVIKSNSKMIGKVIRKAVKRK